MTKYLMLAQMSQKSPLRSLEDNTDPESMSVVLRTLSGWLTHNFSDSVPVLSVTCSFLTCKNTFVSNQMQ